MSDPVTMTISMLSDASAGKQGNIPIAAAAAAKLKQTLKLADEKSKATSWQWKSQVLRGMAANIDGPSFYSK
jgi:hypothetical protein